MMHTLPYIFTILVIGKCDGGNAIYESGKWDPVANMKVPFSLSISKEWALKFDRELGRDGDSMSENKKIEMENNLIEILELLHFVPPGVLPRKGGRRMYPHPFDEDIVSTEPTFGSAYELRGTTPAPEKILPDSTNQESSFTLGLEVTTSKPKVIGHISMPKSVPTTQKPGVFFSASSSTPSSGVSVKPTPTTEYPHIGNDASLLRSQSQDSKLHPAQIRLANMLKLNLSIKGDHRGNPKFALFVDSRKTKSQKEI